MSRQTIEQWKQQYNSYPVPKQLKAEVQKGIRRARKRQQIHRVGAVIAAGILCCLVILPNTSVTMAQTLSKVPVLGNFIKVVTFRVYTDEKENQHAKVEIPQISVENKEKGQEQINQKIKEDTEKIIAQYKKDTKELGGKAHESLDTSYQIVSNTDDLFTLRIDTVIAQGGSNSFSKFYHLEKRTDQIIQLKDLFQKKADYVSIITEEIKRQMREQMKKDPAVRYFIKGEDPDIPEEGFEAIKPDQNFYINAQKQLVIVFDKYEVGPGMMGQPEFLIPAETIQNILQEKPYLKY